MYPRDGTVVKHREEKIQLAFEFSRHLKAGEQITQVLAFGITDSRGTDKTVEFRQGEPAETIGDYEDAGGTVHTNAAVNVWVKKAAGVEQAGGTYRPKCEVQTSLGQKLICMIDDPSDSTSLVLPYLLVTDGLTKSPPGVR